MGNTRLDRGREAGKRRNATKGEREIERAKRRETKRELEKMGPAGFDTPPPPAAARGRRRGAQLHHARSRDVALSPDPGKGRGEAPET